MEHGSLRSAPPPMPQGPPPPLAGPPPPTSMFGGPPPFANRLQPRKCMVGQKSLCCGDGVCDGPETQDNCKQDCNGTNWKGWVRFPMPGPEANFPPPPPE